MKKNVSTTRLGNFDLLRIFSMLLIVTFHYSLHGNLFKANTFSSNQIIAELLLIGGKLGVNLFILMSGYFLIDSKFKFEKVLKLLLQTLFYSISTFILITLTTKANTVIHLETTLHPFSSKLYWFITIYLQMYFLFPFIKKALQSLSEKQYRNILIFFGIILSFIPMFFYNSNLIWGECMWFIYMFAIGGYIKKFDIKFLNNKKTSLTLSISLYLSLLFLFIVYTKLNYANEFIESFLSMNSIYQLSLSISIFYIFKQLKIKNGKIISTLAESSFAVYLIHDNDVFKFHLWKSLKTSFFAYQPLFLLILHIIYSTMIIYIVGTFIEIIRKKLIEIPLFKKIENIKLIQKINETMNI